MTAHNETFPSYDKTIIVWAKKAESFLDVTKRLRKRDLKVEVTYPGISNSYNNLSQKVNTYLVQWRNVAAVAIMVPLCDKKAPPIQLAPLV